jgi:hypothetical protein
MGLCFAADDAEQYYGSEDKQGYTGNSPSDLMRRLTERQYSQ